MRPIIQETTNFAPISVQDIDDAVSKNPEALIVGVYDTGSISIVTKKEWCFPSYELRRLDDSFTIGNGWSAQYPSIFELIEDFPLFKFFYLENINQLAEFITSHAKQK